MGKETGRRGLKADWNMIKRGCGIIRELSPGLLGLSLLKSLLGAFTPYIAIYMSAVIIDELAGKRNFELLLFYAVAAAAGTLLMTIISDLVASKVNVRNAMFDSKFNEYLNNRKLSMDFTKLEDSRYTELREKIMGTTFMTGGGIASVVRLVTGIADGVFSVIIALLVLQGAALTPPASGAGVAGILNSLWFFCILMTVTGGGIALTIRNSRTRSTEEFKLYQGCTTNRYLEYYHFSYMEDDQAGKDIHIFDQRKLIIGEVLSKGRLPWLRVIGGIFGLNQKYFGANAVISAFIGGFAYIFVGLKALSGAISLGDVTKSYGAIIRLISAVGNLSASLSQIKSNNNYLELLYEFMDIPSEVHKGNKIPVQGKEGWEIEFHNVSFRYPSGKDYAIKNLSFKISSHNRTAVVGMNGSGKTTMIKLLCALYQPETGYITLNGTDIREYDYDAYLKLFSVVFQDFKLLAFPIGQNIAAALAYEKKKVWQALKTAGMAHKAEELPLGIKQCIYKKTEEDGMDLSGGEEQKLAIARALYKDAPVIILDEPTAALDPVAEYEIYSKFHEIIGDKAALFVSHRLSSCRFCDRIAVFHEGQIVQLGSHDELLQNTGGKYYELWNAQAGYYQEDVQQTHEG